MSKLGDILLGFGDVIKALPYNFSVAYTRIPANPDKDKAYILPGRVVSLEERGMNRVYEAEISVFISVSNPTREDAGPVIHMTDILQELLNAVDTNKDLQDKIEYCIPGQCPFLFDKDDVQGIAFRITYTVRYLVPRNRPRK